MLNKTEILDKEININSSINKLYHIETYGCQMNVYDSELVAGQLNKLGYKETNKLELADVILLNTCSIREKAEETVHNRLDSLHYLKKNKPNLLIGVLGCMAQNLKNDLLDSKPYVDIILGPDSYRKLSEIIIDRQGHLNHLVDTKLSKYEIYDDMFPSRKEGINAWISIMRGCDKFCTFCIVPFTRGRERSRPVDNIIKEAKKAISEGFVEKSGSWYSFNGNRIGQGRENAKKFLLDNKEIAEEIESMIRKKNSTTEEEKQLEEEKNLEVEN